MTLQLRSTRHHCLVFSDKNGGATCRNKSDTLMADCDAPCVSSKLGRPIQMMGHATIAYCYCLCYSRGKQRSC